MFRFHKPLDTITLFHRAASPTSVHVATLLKQASANASEVTTEDQASDISAASMPAGQRSEFELNITEDAPTADQLRTIMEYAGPGAIPSIVKGARTINEALKRFKESTDNFQRPVVVDWNNGKAQAGGNASEILKMLNSLPKKD